MAWTYSDYITLGPTSAGLTRLRLHIQEVTDKISLEIAADGKSKSSHALQQYLDGLLKKEAQIEKRTGLASARVSQIRLKDENARGGGSG